MDKTGYGPVITLPRNQNDRRGVKIATIVHFHKDVNEYRGLF